MRISSTTWRAPALALTLGCAGPAASGGTEPEGPPEVAAEAAPEAEVAARLLGGGGEVELLGRAELAAAGAGPDALLVARVREGTSAQSHLLVRVEGAWRRGPFLGAGPRAGDAASAVHRLELGDPALVALIPGGPPEARLRYAIERREEGAELVEEGWIVCLDLLGSSDCARLPERVVRTGPAPGARAELTATITFGGDGTYTVEDLVGEDRRLRAGTHPLVDLLGD